MNNHWILKDGKAVPATLQEFAEFYRDLNNRLIAKRMMPSGVEVSTVFTGRNHGVDDANPILVETLVTGGEFNGERRHYSTYEEALIGHRHMTDVVTGDVVE